MKHDICIVGLKCYSLLSNQTTPKYLGGIERVLVALAHGLKDHGLSVAFITFDEGQDSVTVEGGITVYSAYKDGTGLPIVRMLHPKASSIRKAMRAADANIYLQMGAGIETFWVTLFAQEMKRKSVFGLASDSDAMAELPLLTSPIERWLYPKGLLAAGQVVSQSIRQQQLLRKNYACDSTTIAMPYMSKAPDSTTATSKQKKVLWIGRMVEGKRVELYLELAKAFPDTEFHIIGAANTESEYSRINMAHAKKIPNVIVHGRISDDELLQLYETSQLLLCTSVMEGFPTTFLEAWSYRVPVVTTYDPDDTIVNNQLGAVASDLQSLISAVKNLIGNVTELSACAERCRKFYLNNYTNEAIIPSYLEIFEQMKKR